MLCQMGGRQACARYGCAQIRSLPEAIEILRGMHGIDEYPNDFSKSPHSYRTATMGSTFGARRAGR